MLTCQSFYLTTLALQLRDYVGATILEFGEDLYGCSLDRLLTELLAIVIARSFFNAPRGLSLFIDICVWGNIELAYYGSCKTWFESGSKPRL
jgi:hypothetical protein